MGVDELLRKINQFTMERLPEQLQYYLPPRVCEHDSEEAVYKNIANIDNRVADFLDESPGKDILLLVADGGMGKSLLLNYIARQYQSAYTILLIPLLVTSGDFQFAKENLVEDFLRTTNGLEFKPYEIERLKREHRGRLVVAFDGVDELYGEPANLYRSNKFADWQIKCIFTCRPLYLSSLDQQVEELFGSDVRGQRSLLKLHIEPFNAEDIKSFLIKYRENFNSLNKKIAVKRCDQLDEVIERIPHITSLFANPYLLSMVLEVLEEIDFGVDDAFSNPSSYQRAQRLTTYDIYEQIAQSFFNRELEKYKKANRSERVQITDPFTGEKRALTIADYHRYNMCVARKLKDHESEVLDLSPVEVVSDDEDFAMLIQNWTKDFFAPDDPIQQALFHGLMVKEIADNKYTFLHDNWRQFFLADFIFKYPCYQKIEKSRRRVIQRSLCDNLVKSGEYDVLQRMADYVKTKYINGDREWVTELLDLILDTRFEDSFRSMQAGALSPSSGYEQASDNSEIYAPNAAANAISILNLANIPFAFELARHPRGEKTFERINIPYADLSGANLRDLSFRGANLAGAILSRSCLDRTIFSGAILDGVVFDQMPKLRLAHTVRGINIFHLPIQHEERINNEEFMAVAGFDLQRPKDLMFTIMNMNFLFEKNESPSSANGKIFRIRTFKREINDELAIKLKIKHGLFALAITDHDNDLLIIGRTDGKKISTKKQFHEIRLKDFTKKSTVSFQLLDLAFSANADDTQLYLLYSRSIKTEKVVRGVLGARMVFQIDYENLEFTQDFFSNPYIIDHSYEPAQLDTLTDQHGDFNLVVSDSTRNGRINFYNLRTKQLLSSASSPEAHKQLISLLNQDNVPLKGNYLNWARGDCQRYEISATEHEVRVSSVNSANVFTYFSDQYLGAKTTVFSYLSHYLVYGNINQPDVMMCDLKKIICSSSSQMTRNNSSKHYYQNCYLLPGSQEVEQVVSLKKHPNTFDGSQNITTTIIPGHFSRCWQRYQVEYSISITTIRRHGVEVLPEKSHSLCVFQYYNNERLEIKFQTLATLDRFAIGHLYTSIDDKGKTIAKPNSKDIRICAFKSGPFGWQPTAQEFYIRTQLRCSDFAIMPDFSAIVTIYDHSVNIYNFGQLTLDRNTLVKPHRIIKVNDLVNHLLSIGHSLRLMKVAASSDNQRMIAFGERDFFYYLKYWYIFNNAVVEIRVTEKMPALKNAFILGPLISSDGNFAVVSFILKKSGLAKAIIFDLIKKEFVTVDISTLEFENSTTMLTCSAADGMFFDPINPKYRFAIRGCRIYFFKMGETASDKNKLLGHSELTASQIISFHCHPQKRKIVINEIGKRNYTLFEWDILDNKISVRLSYSGDPYLKCSQTDFSGGVYNLGSRNAKLLYEKSQSPVNPKLVSEATLREIKSFQAITLSYNSTFTAVFDYREKNGPKSVLCLQPGKGILTIGYKKSSPEHLFLLLEIIMQSQGQWYYIPIRVDFFIQRRYSTQDFSVVKEENPFKVVDPFIQYQVVTRKDLLEMRNDKDDPVFYKSEQITTTESFNNSSTNNQQARLFNAVRSCMSSVKNKELAYYLLGGKSLATRTVAKITSNFPRPYSPALFKRDNKKYHNCVTFIEDLLKEIDSTLLPEAGVLKKAIPRKAAGAYFMQDAVSTQDKTKNSFVSQRSWKFAKPKTD